MQGGDKEEKKVSFENTQGNQQKKAKKEKPDKDPNAEKAAGKTLTPEEKKAQREAVNAEKARKKELAALKKKQKAAEEQKDDAAPDSKKDKKKKPEQNQPGAPDGNAQTGPAPVAGALQVPKSDTPFAHLGAAGKLQNTGGKSERKLSIIMQTNAPVKKITTPSVSKNMHPAVHDLSLKLIAEKFVSTNQVTLAILLTLKEVIRDFQHTKKNKKFELEIIDLIFATIIPLLENCRRLYAGTDYALQYLRSQMNKLYMDESVKGLDDFKEKIIDIIDEFLQERIVIAQDAIVDNALKMLSDKRQEVILVYGNQESAIIEEILTKANEKLSRGIKVIVVDSAPEYYGRNLVKRLSSKGLQCQYTMLSMVNFLINTVTKVLIASTYILCNGALVAPMGTSMIGCIASQNKIPVVAVCETYKFADRVNLDQVNNNEQGHSSKFTTNYLRKISNKKEFLDQIVEINGKKNCQTKVDTLSLKYDLTPQKYLNMITCEIGNIAPHSIPVVIHEIKNDFEHDDQDQVDSSSSSPSEDDDIQEEANEEDEDDQMFGPSKQDLAKNKRLAEAKKRALGQME